MIERLCMSPPLHPVRVHLSIPISPSDVGIEKIRRAVEEANEQKKVAAKQRDRVAPKMGRMDVDYQVLHDAFFKWQTKPPLSGPGADSVLLIMSRRWRLHETASPRRRRGDGVRATQVRSTTRARSSRSI